MYISTYNIRHETSRYEQIIVILAVELLRDLFDQKKK